jgi:hypothetical protein
MNTEWITDRLPTEEDALEYTVLLWDGSKAVLWSYDGVNKGQPWAPIHKLKEQPWAPIHKIIAPYVKPKRWTVEFSEYDNTWIMRDNVEGWVRLLYIDRCHGDAAQRIADIYNEVKP